MSKKKRELTKWQRIGRNSKNKGRAYERRIADTLGWTRVPFSGAARDWGEGDVVDGYYSRSGFWVGECKKQPARKSGDVVVEEAWMKQISTMKLEDRHLVLFTQPHGGRTTYVFLPLRSMRLIDERALATGRQLPYNKHLITAYPQGGGFTGFKIKKEEFDKYKNDVVYFQHYAMGAPWFMMRLELFKWLITEYEITANDQDEGSNSQ